MASSQNRNDISNDRTMECMVCGKLFPRGPVDLARHTTAVTLKHLYQEKKTAMYNVGCTKCGLFFTSKEHCKMHRKDSTCRTARAKPASTESTLESTREEKKRLNQETEDDEDDEKDDAEEKRVGDVEDDTTKTLECKHCYF